MDRQTLPRPWLREAEGNLRAVPVTDAAAVDEALARLDAPFRVRPAAASLNGSGDTPMPPDVVAVPALPMENLGDPTFRADQRLRYAYVAGAMANGIGSAEIV